MKMTAIKQQGAALLMVIITLVILLVASMAFMQSTEVVNIVAGNIAFKQAASEKATIGINQAMTELTNRTDTETNVTGVYYATQQAVDTNGLPTTVNWSQVPVTTSQGYTIQHITERLCSGTLPITDATSQCAIAQTNSAGSNKLGSAMYTGSSSFFYRVTVLVSGPKGTVSYIQAILKK